MKKWTDVPAGEINAANQRLWGALDNRADEVATRINTDPAFVARIVQLMVDGGVSYEPSSSQKHAREIMGRNFFGVEEAIKHFGVSPSKQQLAILVEVPFSQGVLESCKDTHILVAVFPMSILDIRGKVERKFFYSHEDAWYNKQAFAKNKGEVGWQLVRKVPVADSTNKTWNEQQALFSKDEETPKAQVMVYTIIGHFLATSERLFEGIYARCSDLDSGGGRVIVGFFDANGLFIGYYWDDDRDGGIGLSAARK